jgi:hypothetical protein
VSDPTDNAARYSASVTWSRQAQTNDGHSRTLMPGGIAVSGTAVIVAVVSGPAESKTAGEVAALIEAHVNDDGAYSIDSISVGRSYRDLYAIMYVVPVALDLDIAKTRVRCSVDVVGNRVRAEFDPLTADIAQRAAQLWGTAVALVQMPADRPRLGGFPARRRRVPE